MNLVGKILVVLIFVMSLIFMGFAVSVYSTHRNWVEASNKLKGQRDAAQAKNTQLLAEFTSIQTKISEIEAARRQTLAKLETEKEQLVKEKEALAAQEADLSQKFSAITVVADGALSQLKDKQTQVDSLRNDIQVAQAERDENFKKVVDATDKLNQSSGELKRLETTNVRLAEQMAKAKILLERKQTSIDAPVDGIPPVIDGIVLATTGSGLVEISLGSDMGLARGNTLEVSRGSKYLGRLEVIQTTPDKSVARVLPQYQKGRIEKEDRVQTRLN